MNYIQIIIITVGILYLAYTIHDRNERLKIIKSKSLVELYNNIKIGNKK